MSERLIKIDAEIWETEQMLKECEAPENREALAVLLVELKKKRDEILKEIENKARARIQ